ncbi:response regulator transcription factor [Thermoactinospora rubra]|uniref:response regulator transcription factor n=1 Tax=Thermoactinospora rubra TaxID=1088767 RepID=UPI000A0FD96F|nr:response regulator transcription factor [Thermoactinospora rubra]
MLKVLLAEDVHMVRGALAALLELEHDLTVVAQVDTGDKIVPAALEKRPDVAVIDIDMPKMDGLTAAGLLHKELPSCRTLILTGLGRPGTLRRALSVSVSGFILKDAPSDQLATAIRAVASGRRVVDPQLALTAWDVGENPLTSREIEVLEMAAQGAEAPEIAASLHLSVGTVRNHLTRITTKLNARNRVDAIRIAIEAGWFSPKPK